MRARVCIDARGRAVRVCACVCVCVFVGLPGSPAQRIYMVALAFPRFKALQVRVFSKNVSVAVHGGLPTDAVYTQVFEKKVALQPFPS